MTFGYTIERLPDGMWRVRVASGSRVQIIEQRGRKSEILALAFAALEEMRGDAVEARRTECTSCHGRGHFSEAGEPSIDRRDRACLDCSGEGDVVAGAERAAS